MFVLFSTNSNTHMTLPYRRKNATSPSEGKGRSSPALNRGKRWSANTWKTDHNSTWPQTAYQYHTLLYFLPPIYPTLIYPRYQYTYVKTMTTGLSDFVSTMIDFHIISPENTIMTKYRVWNASCRFLFHCFFNSFTWLSTNPTILRNQYYWFWARVKCGDCTKY